MNKDKVFYSPGPFCNTDTYELIEGSGSWTEAELAENGYQMAIEHYESYGDAEEDDLEPEYDYAWYEQDNPEIIGRF